MFVAKYPAWVAEIIHENGDVEFFDGVKDMMAYYFHPDQYGGGGKTDNAEIWVKDYYSLSFIDARKAFFVTGSDVFGPMGHEFIPFSSQEASEAFLKDHKAKSILTFTEITEQMVDSMREGRKMK
jgi:nitrous oxide reductase accessory protein NosL